MKHTFQICTSIFTILILFNIKHGLCIRTYHMEDMCGQRISMITENTRDAIISYTHKSHSHVHGSHLDCTLEMWGWFEEDLAMRFTSFNTTNCSTFIYLRQGDSWEESRPIAGPPTSLCGQTFNQLNTVFQSDWMDVFIRVEGDSPPDGATVFSLTLNTIHDAPCSSRDYTCDNTKCIHASLNCSGYNPCGDDSDCRHTNGVLFIILSFSVSGGVMLVVYIALHCFVKLRKRRQERLRESGTSHIIMDSMNTSHDEPTTVPTVLTSHLDDATSGFYTEVVSNNGVNSAGSVTRDPNNVNIEPPDYNTVLAQNNDSTIDNQRDNPVTHPGDNSDYLPSYREVIGNAEAYKIIIWHV